MGAPGDVFKAYDIRGVVPDQLDEPLCRALGSAVARFTGADRLLVARDMRTSGVALSAAFIEGVLSEGTSVTDLGLASTDLLYFASGRLDAPGAMFTASHNPAQYNGVKMCLAGARPIGQDTGLAEIRALTEAALAGSDAGSGTAGRGFRDPRSRRRAGLGSPPGERTAQPGVGLGTHAPEEDGVGSPPGSTGTVEHRDLLQDYADHVRSFVDAGVLRPLRVVADTANGMGGLVAPAVFQGLPFQVDILFPELDGSFPNHPADPIQPANLADLKAAVLAQGADVGLAFDGDADRVFLVDERAEPVSGSLTTALVASAMLDKHPGSTVLYNLICSRVVPEVIAEHGGTGVRTRVGHSFIKQTMAETGAVFGGEHSGHYYFRDNYRADSGLIAALVVLELLSRAGTTLSTLLEPFRRYADSGEINTEVPDPAAAVEAVAERVAAAGAATDRLDGLTVTYDDWWFNLRPSNTEPLLRLNVEASTEEACAAHVADVLEMVRASAGTAASDTAGTASGDTVAGTTGGAS